MAGTPTDAAIDWMVLLRSGDATADDHARLQAWVAADPAHHAAWQQIANGLDASFAPIRQTGQQDLVRRTLLERSSFSRRRVLRGGLAVVVMGSGVAWVAGRSELIAPHLADHRSGVAERRRIILPDDSELLLNADSAVDVAYSPTRRHLRLLRGALLVQVAADTARPFVVETAEGQVQALGTRFSVRQGDGRSHVAVQEHSVLLRTHGGAQAVLPAGEARWFDAAGIGDPAPAAAATAWADGLFVARDEALGELVEAMRPYRRGLLRISPEAARLRVFGVFPLDDTDALLESLAQTQPVRIDARAGGWWVTIERQ